MAVLGAISVLGAAYVTFRAILEVLEAVDAGFGHDIPGDEWED